FREGTVVPVNPRGTFYKKGKRLIDNHELEELRSLEEEEEDCDSTFEPHPKTLQELCAQTLASSVTPNNVLTLAARAMEIYDFKLADYCGRFVERNLDVVVEKMGERGREKDRRTLVELFGGYEDEGEEEGGGGGTEAETDEGASAEPVDKVGLIEGQIDFDDPAALKGWMDKVNREVRRAKKQKRNSSGSRGEELGGWMELRERIERRIIYFGVGREDKNMCVVVDNDNKAEGPKRKPDHDARSAAPPTPPTTYRCEVCNVEASDELNLAIHLAGKRHRNTLKRAEEEEIERARQNLKVWGGNSNPNKQEKSRTKSLAEIMGEEALSKRPPPPPPQSSPPQFLTPTKMSPTNGRLSPSSAGPPSPPDSGPRAISLFDVMNAGKRGKVTPKVKHVGCLGTLTPSPVISPWKTPTPTKKKLSPDRGKGSLLGDSGRPPRKISFNEIVEEERREREGAAPQTRGEDNKWFVERRVRGDSLDKIQLQEEEKRQMELRVEREREELERLKKEKRAKDQQMECKTKMTRGKGKGSGSGSGKAKASGKGKGKGSGNSKDKNKDNGENANTPNAKTKRRRRRGASNPNPPN
ncbi:hypothetical protein TrRE_jg7698, partial [Triparma retinervis]